VDGENSGTLRITSSALADYNYPAVTLQPGTYTIGLKGGNIAQGRNVFVDVVSFPAADTTPPDPGKIVFSVGGCGGCERARIWTINPDGSERQQVDLSGIPFAPIPSLTQPTLSPDGSKMAFVLSHSPSRLYISNPDGSGLQLVDEDHGIGNPSWSPDGSKIVYQEYPDIKSNNPELVVRDLAGGNEQTIVPSGSGASDPNLLACWQ
jgi:hypothetical protein